MQARTAAKGNCPEAVAITLAAHSRFFMEFATKRRYPSSAVRAPRRGHRSLRYLGLNMLTQGGARRLLNSSLALGYNSIALTGHSGEAIGILPLHFSKNVQLPESVCSHIQSIDSPTCGIIVILS